MDTSEQYIKMCDCPEIQDGHKIDDGDFYFRKLPSEEIGDWYISYTSQVDDYTEEHPDQWDYLHSKIIWLPRQDQLQEMAWHVTGVGYSSDLDLLTDFNNFCFPLDDLGIMPHHRSVIAAENKDKYIRQLTSMEQLWLAFVMKEKYSKVWNGTEWTSA